MADIAAVQIPRETIAHVLPLIHPHLARFCKRFPAEYGLGDCLSELLDGTTHGFMAWEPETNRGLAFAYGRVVDDHDGTRSLRMEMIEGVGLSAWREALEAEFSAFAKKNNCIRIRFTGRKGWARKLTNWRPVYTVFEREP